MKRYEIYKPSGVDWIGDIPEHWNMTRISNFGSFFKGNGIKKDEVKESGIPCIRYGEIYTQYDRIVYKPVSYIDEETSKNSVIVRKGDILFTGSGETIGDIGKSVLYFGEGEIFAGGDIIVLRLNADLNPLYISYLVNTNFIQYQKSLSGKGEIIVHIYPKNIKEIKTPLPPIEEQTYIANYLDNKTKQIDDLINKKQNLIELLKEEKTAIINQAVRLGFEDMPKTVTNGAVWLGEINANWSIKRLKYLCKITTGSKNTEDRIDDGTYPFYVRSQTIERINSYSYDCVGILTAGDGVGVGKVFHLVSGKFEIHQRVYLFYDFSKEILPEYLFFYLKQNLINELMIYNAKSTVDSVRLPVLQDFQVVYPKLQEQEKIVAKLKRNLSKIDNVCSLSEREIELLKEYRLTLINEVVTGKIKVF